MPNIVKEPKEILHKCIQNFYKSNPLARFEDIPNKLFIEAMQMYADEQLSLQRQELMSILTIRVLKIQSEPDGIVRETMINNLLVDINYKHN